MAIEFPGTTSSGPGFSLGDHAVIDNLTTFTFAAWCKPMNWGGSDRGTILGKQGLRYFGPLKGVSPSGDNDGRFYCVLARTVVAEAIAAEGSAHLNKWQFYVGTHAPDTGGPRIYRAEIGGVPTEVSYNTRSAGSGTFTAEGAVGWKVGNGSATDTFAFGGSLAEVSIFNRVLTLGEMKHLMYNPAASLDALFYMPMWPTTGLAGTLSGKTVAGTVVAWSPSNATIRGHPPLGRYRRNMGNPTAAIQLAGTPPPPPPPAQTPYTQLDLRTGWS
jgi:hypothetical protein